jgi:fucose permease
MATTATEVMHVGADAYTGANEASTVQSHGAVSETMEVEEPPDNAQVFTVPDVKSIRWKIYSAIFSSTVAGMNDAALGALVPYLQESYDIGLLFVSVVYLINFSGFLIAAFSNVHLTSRIGQGGVFVFGAVLQATAYSLNFWEPPYALFVASFIFSGSGRAYQAAQANVLLANVQNSHRWLGLLHAFYGAGALVAPLVATGLAANTSYWHYWYLIMLGVEILNTLFLAWSYRTNLFRPASTKAKDTASHELKSAPSKRSTWSLSAFFFLYVGVEVASGGWVVEFLIRARHGEPSKVGYVASGFYSGLTLGRLVLAEPTHRWGEYRMIFAYIVVGLILQLMYWFIPNIIANAVCLSLLG